MLETSEMQLDCMQVVHQPGSTSSGSSPGAADAGLAPKRPGVGGEESARIDREGGDAGDARADHARPPPNARASERQPGWKYILVYFYRSEAVIK